MAQDRKSVTSSASGAGVLFSQPGSVGLYARCWGTRGSLPSPGPHTVRYGGNTSCIEVCSSGGRRFVFDAGSGIRPLGERIVAGGQAHTPLDLFLSHFHWDHIQGLPFFAPLYDPATQLTIHGARQGDRDAQSLIAGQMGPVYFPVPFEAISAKLQFHDVTEAAWQVGDVQVAAFRVRHPMFTYGYRIRSRGASIAYIPDNELVGGPWPMVSGWYDALCEFVAGADVLLHDAMFTDAEYPHYEGWGHSSFSQATQLAIDAGVRRLHLFHHSPERTDDQLDRILLELREDVASRGFGLEVGVAAEGEELLVEERIP